MMKSSSFSSSNLNLVSIALVLVLYCIAILEVRYCIGIVLLAKRPLLFILAGGALTRPFQRETDMVNRRKHRDISLLIS